MNTPPWPRPREPRPRCDSRESRRARGTSTDEYVIAADAASSAAPPSLFGGASGLLCSVGGGSEKH